jgi:hypothetical protein
MNIIEDIEFVRSVLPDHYTVRESKVIGSIHCQSSIGIRKGVDGEDDEKWQEIFSAFKERLKERFQEVFHNVCFCHTDFTIYLKPRVD